LRDFDLGINSVESLRNVAPSVSAERFIYESKMHSLNLKRIMRVE
jgi:hypothetical protein